MKFQQKYDIDQSNQPLESKKIIISKEAFALVEAVQELTQEITKLRLRIK